MDAQDKPIVIELIDVVKRFGSQMVLDRINLQIREGTTTVIVGASGQGKSVLLKHMLGLIRPSEGRVQVFGKDLAHLGISDLRQVRTAFGVLFQNVALFDSMSVFDNVALPLRERTRLTEEEIRKVVHEKLELMDLHNIDEKFPAQISGGMQKRVGLARALVLNPKVIFFDEPTTGLDVSKSKEIYRLLHRTQKQLNYTAVIVSHDVPKILKLSDYVALIADNSIQDCLTPEDFQLSTNHYIRSFVESTMGPIYSSVSEETGFYEKT